MMKRLIIVFALIAPMVLSTQMRMQKKYVIEFYNGKKMYCDSFYLHNNAYLIDIIDQEKGYIKKRTYKSILVKNLLPANDSTCWQ